MAARRQNIGWLLLAMLLLSACGSSKSPVVSLETVDRFAESEKLGGRIITIVQRGDTWYGIAFANNLSVSELTAWNGMSESDKLRIGQRLRLIKPPGFQAAPARTVAATGQANVPSKTPSTSAGSRTTVQASRPANNTANAPTRQPARQNTKPSIVVKPATKPAVKPKPTPKPQTKSAGSPYNQSVVRWQWPLRGKVISRFSPNAGRKGIDISGQQNQAVKVAAPGKVVYQGNGIKGYNNLIIIKHTEDLLSAYAHNQRVFVQEGQWVKTDQTISTVGLRNGKPLLHFEIRKNGKPVDPLRYLGK